MNLDSFIRYRCGSRSSNSPIFARRKPINIMFECGLEPKIIRSRLVWLKVCTFWWPIPDVTLVWCPPCPGGRDHRRVTRDRDRWSGHLLCQPGQMRTRDQVISNCFVSIVINELREVPRHWTLTDRASLMVSCLNVVKRNYPLQYLSRASSVINHVGNWLLYGSPLAWHTNWSLRVIKLII